ncbi:MAG: DNA polymerase III subunit alpha [Schleiferiaceae bacterium]|jgi:error-prone DNA polymerase|nr:DNA polymerase III subunit alpha [Schleiferiaceae bacterium]MDP4876781.1 DNA polymerase III subunit alpha [Schleiferiaceae bacterium]MDP4958989.1 DNA polymerase III subunit alpha [Schleiferiaceae bacterium]
MLVNSHSYYSLRYGVLSPKEWLAFFESQPWPVMAITDINNTSACMTVLYLLRNHPKKRAVIGVDFRNGITPCYVALAKNWEGFRQINDHLSEHLHRKQRFSSRAPVAALKDAWIIYPLESLPPDAPLAPNELIGVRADQLRFLHLSPHASRQHKLIAMPTATFRGKRDHNAHRLLRAIDENALLSKLSKDKQAKEDDLYLSNDELRSAYAEVPYLLRQAQQVLEDCTVLLPDEASLNLQTYTGSKQKDLRLLKKLAYDGIAYRYPTVDFKVKERIEKELELIAKKNFVSYFLINWDIVNYAQKRGYFYVGRGSGANSIVAYLLKITDVDPIELDLYFERFINLYRTSPPDFDLDFSWRDRDDITQYIFKRFPHTALLATYNTFQYRAVVRELGKVFGLPKHEIDKLSRGKFTSNELDQLGHLVLRYSTYIQGFPSHLSIHAGGILIAEKSIHYHTGTFLPPKGFATTQFDMVVAEDIGLHKFDILSQRGLSKIQDTLHIIRKNKPEDRLLDIRNLQAFKQDEKIKSILRDGRAMGCFYVESPAMRMLLKKLKVDTYLGLVAASSIIRPGVSNSGMMREYILRFTDPERRQDAHPVLLDIMPDTFGVMVYQEDVIKVAHYFAGLSLGEADVLRRGMSGKFRSREEFKRVENQYFENCKARGYSLELAQDIWRQIESFAGYAFAKGHSASYAVESYQSLYLKAHYPLEYMVAVINNFGGFYSTEFYVHEARKLGGIVEAPCVQQGDYPTVIRGTTIYLGFVLLHGLDETVGVTIGRERQEGGPFSNLTDFIDRVPIGIEQLSLLIRIGAFRFTGVAKQTLLWEAHHMLKGHKQSAVPAASLSLFKGTVSSHDYKVPLLEQSALEQAFDEIELLGFPLADPFLLADEPMNQGTTAIEFPEKLGHFVIAYGYLVTVKDTKTQKGDRMNFATFVDQNGDFLDSVHFPNIAAQFPFRGKGLYKVQGRVVEEFGFYSIEASALYKLAVIPDPRYEDQMARSKDNYSKTKGTMKRGSKPTTG